MWMTGCVDKLCCYLYLQNSVFNNGENKRKEEVEQEEGRGEMILVNTS